MSEKEILLIVLAALLVLIVVVGCLLKRFTKRRLREIDGFRGVFRKKKCRGTSLGVEQTPAAKTPAPKTPAGKSGGGAS